MKCFLPNQLHSWRRGDSMSGFGWAKGSEDLNEMILLIILPRLNVKIWASHCYLVNGIESG